MKILLGLLAALVLHVPAFGQSNFEGELVLLPPGCEQSGACKLKDRLRFTDSRGVVWEAAAGLPTDGASIPSFFQPFIGNPFDPRFIKAAVVHDHYCRRQVRPWRDTHKVFYEGLLDQGVDAGQAKLMYYAVYLGGPKWVKLVPGNKCDGNCINRITTASGEPVINFREADYALFDMENELRAVQQELAANPGMSLQDLETRARKKRPGDYYYRHGDSVRVDGVLQ